ncbi:hypothetical protein BKA66DRAFT_488010 [Pyrenochaeta sp. MPI-SDFR-AT-0127]|nr:hypothetical protein BKA66DRAFT_488010 [Pyrenochaeta sp. MPI-SDFR-AT-0127]
MLLVAHRQPSFSYTTVSRSSTFPRPAVTIAQERVRQVTGHFVRSNTMASMCSKEEARDAEPPKATTTTDKKSGAVDIDQAVEDKFNQLPPLPSPLPNAHPDFVHCMPPEPPTYRKFSIFTAGSIEMGKAVQWQKQMATSLSHLPITVNNPRRGHWDPNATQEAKNEEFRKQVEWELSALEQADVICFFFDVNTMSPVTMLELGLWAASGKVVVCCDKRFWRAGNVHIVCDRYKVPFVDTFADLPPAIEAMLKQKGMQLDSNGDLIGLNQYTPKEIKKVTFGS